MLHLHGKSPVVTMSQSLSRYIFGWTLGFDYSTSIHGGPPKNVVVAHLGSHLGWHLQCWPQQSQMKNHWGPSTWCWGYHGTFHEGSCTHRQPHLFPLSGWSNMVLQQSSLATYRGEREVCDKVGRVGRVKLVQCRQTLGVNGGMCQNNEIQNVHALFPFKNCR